MSAQQEELVDDLMANLGLGTSSSSGGDGKVPVEEVSVTKKDPEQETNDDDLLANLGLASTTTEEPMEETKESEKQETKPTEEEEEWLDVEVPKDASPTTSTSLKNEISVINQLMPIQPVVTDEETGEPKKHVVQKVMDDIGKNVQTMAKNVQGAVEQHVAPRVTQIGQETTQKWTNLSQHTKAAMDQHVAPHVETIGKRTSQTFAELGQHTSRTMTSVGQGTTKTFTELGQNTSRTLSAVGEGTSKKFQEMSASTKGALDEHVAPHVTKLQQESYQKWNQVSESTRGAYVQHVEPHVDTVSSTARTYAPYYMNTAPAVWDYASESQLVWIKILEGTTRSFGQVVFCNNPVTGFLIWFAVLVACPLAALCSLLCSASINFTATGLGMDEILMRKGVLAYNGVMVGLGIATLIVFHTWLGAIFLSVLAGPITLLAYGYTLSIVSKPLLFPSVGVMVFFLLSAKYWDAVVIDVTQDESYNMMHAVFRGISQVFFIGNVFSGVLVWCGVLLCSRILGAAVLVGSLVGGIIGVFVLGDHMTGMAGFNPALSTAALLYFVLPSKSALALSFFGIILTIVAQMALVELFSVFALPVLTLPFCLATLPIISMDVDAWFGSDKIQLIPPAELSTPEEHLKRELEKAQAAVAKADDLELDIEEQKVQEENAEEIEAKFSEDTTATEDTPLLAKE